MKRPRHLSTVLLAILLAACVFAYFWTRESASPAAPQSTAAAEQLVDTSRLQDAVRMASFAAMPDEQAQAREAWRLADHELDLSFASAIRAAEAEAELPAKGSLRQLSDHAAALRALVQTDTRRVDALGKDGGDALDRAQAELQLDQDELDDAEQELARQGGDKRGRLQRLLQEHEASDKVADQAIQFPSRPATETMSEQIRTWFSIGDYERQLQASAQAAAAHDRYLRDQHDAIDGRMAARPDESAPIASLRAQAAQHQELAGLDRRRQDTAQLVAVYQKWGQLAEARRHAVLHLLLRSLAAILGIVLAAVLLSGLFRRAFRETDRRRLHQLRIIARIALQMAAALLILLIVFGPPSQISTMIGLVTAGLTVVLKDFIVSFFGWFALMGKNGISVGDWVEIEGVSGEVIEIGLLKTVLLEMGNWTETGHPTGRRVSFSNSFAMERHFFNFSTAGQWLWDEIRVTLPLSGDPYATAGRIREIVEHETEADAAEAAKDWDRVTHKYGAREFSAGPAVNLRPVSSGLEAVVRYITRAPQRNAVKSKLFQSIVDLLRQPA